MISAGELRNGVTMEYEGEIYSVLEFQHVKPGKGAAFVRTRLKNIKTGAVVEKTFRPTEKMSKAHINPIFFSIFIKLNFSRFFDIKIFIGEWTEMVRKYGSEYGAATKRPRRVGPFDAVASRYGLKCQHADKIALTKLDVLSIMDQIPVITGYQYKNAVTNVFDPTENLEKYTPVVKMLPGWKTDISNCRSYDELPVNAKRYINFLEDMLRHEIQFVSVGAERNQYLLNGKWL